MQWWRGVAGLLAAAGVLSWSTASQPQRVAVGGWHLAAFPVEQFVSYTSPFGPRGDEFHYGLDIAAPEGSYIRNWWVGQVVQVSQDGYCGTTVIIASGRWRHVYCHLRGQPRNIRGVNYLDDPGSGLVIREGQWVPTGARIGRVGMTGRTTGPHLHWGLQYDGNWIDPALILRAMYHQRQAQRRTG
ncbi:MAG: M23 family metallopeptidase [Gloeomargarita sp. SKYG116]|nr:M23 family metallopeptidase [Gloeomargarita sp. SKYG116]MDW8400875.1 M23 family metallopeptidase [Gloeomargarita sp. SKYGB_i_bin116]